MNVEHLDVVLDAEITPLERKLARADALADRTEEKLNRVKITGAQAAESGVAAGRIGDAVSSLDSKATSTAERLGRVKITTTQALESTAAGDVIDRKLKDITGNANEARRAVESVGLAGAVFDTTAGRFRGGGGRFVGGGGGGLPGGGGGAGGRDDRVRLGGGRNGAGIGPIGSGFGRIGLLGAGIGAGVLTGPAVAPAALGLLAGIPTLAAAGAGAVGTLALAFAGVGKAIGGDKKAFDKLTSSQQAFVLKIRSLDGWLQKLKQTAGANLFPGLTKGLESALSPGTVAAVAKAVQQFASAIGQAGAAWGRYFGSKQFQQIFGPLMTAGAKNLGTLSNAFLSLFDALGVVGRAAIPLVTWLTNLSARGAQLADTWLRAKDASGGLAKSMTEAQSSLALVGRLVASLGRVVYALGKALYPVSKVAVKDLTDGLNALAGIFDRNQKGIRAFVQGALDALVSSVKIAAPVVAHLAHGASDVVKAVGGWKTAFEIVIGGALALKVGKLATMIGGTLVKAIKVAQVAYGMFTGVVIAETDTAALAIKAGLISTGIGALVVALGLAAAYTITHWQKVKGWFEALGTFFRTLGQEIINVFEYAWTEIERAAVYAALQIVKAFDITILGRHLIPGVHALVDSLQAELDSLHPPNLDWSTAAAQQGANTGIAWGTAFEASVQAAIDQVNQQGVMKTVPMEGTLSGSHVFTPTKKTGAPTPGTSVFGKPPPFTKNLGPKAAFTPLPSGLATQLANAQTAAQGGGLKELQQLEGVEKRALAYLNQEHVTGKKLVAVAKERLTITRQLAQTEKLISQQQAARREEKILGLAPGGGQTSPGAVALRMREHKILEAEIARSFGGGKNALNTAAAQLGISTTTLLHKTNEQLIAEMKSLGIKLPAATLDSLKKINAVLKNKFLPPDVRENLRARLAQIEETLKASTAKIASNYHAVHSTDIVKGLGLDRAAKLAVEMRVSQALAHQGTAPSAPAVNGIPLGTAKNPYATSTTVQGGVHITLQLSDVDAKDAKSLAKKLWPLIESEMEKAAARNGG